ncbi:MAG: TrmJ/YjtD family RNA methyltransferase [Candidatus Micrarchaeia archaeon]
MELRIVLVEPEYAFNVGSVCRAMKNFGQSELFLVNPKCQLGTDAYKGAKHSKDVLESAKTVRTLKDAVAGCGLIAGTTGIKLRNKGTIRSVIGLRDFLGRLHRCKSKKIALVFGREGIGLNERELNECDLLTHIECSPAYPVLNLSHAVAIILYSISRFSGSQAELPARKSELRALLEIFSGISSKYRRKNNLAPVAFRRVVSRAAINEQEARALLNLFRLILEDAG